MSYATKEDIASEFKRLSFTGIDPVITETEVDEFIIQSCAMIDSMLCSRYTTPVTATTALIVLKKITIDFVSFRIEKILKIKNVKQSSSKNFEQSSPRYICYKESMKLLEMFSTGKAKLADAELDLGDNSQISAGAITTVNGVPREPIFQRYKDQW